MVGKYVQIRDSYISLNEALMHAGLKDPHPRARALRGIHDIERDGVGSWRGWMPSWCRGLWESGIEGKIQAVRYAPSSASLTWNLSGDAAGHHRVRGAMCWA